MDAGNKKSILVVDDNATNLRVMQEVLKIEYKVYATISGEKALAFLEKTRPDLILLDIEMPDLSGYDVINLLKEHSKWKTIPVIFLTAKDGADDEEKAFKMGAIDYIHKPISPRVVLSRVATHLELEDYRVNLEQKVQEKTSLLEMTQDAILDILTSVTAFRDNETGGHVMRTTLYAKLISECLLQADYPGITDGYAQDIVKCAKLHDIGKVAISDRIMLKPDRLTAEEFETMKSHTIVGGEMIDNAIKGMGNETTFLSVAKEIVLYHHEHWDGTGYPKGLQEDEIPLSARIMALADVYDALTSNRPYKNAYCHDEAMKIIRSEAGHFDPHIVELCETLFERFEHIGRICNDETYPVYSSEILQSMFTFIEA